MARWGKKLFKAPPEWLATCRRLGIPEERLQDKKVRLAMMERDAAIRKILAKPLSLEMPSDLDNLRAIAKDSGGSSVGPGRCCTRLSDETKTKTTTSKAPDGTAVPGSRIYGRYKE